MFRRILVSTNLTDGLYRLSQFLPSLAAGGIEQIVFLHCVPLINFPTPLLYALTAEELDLRCRHLFRYVAIPYDDTGVSQQLVAEFKRYAAQRPANSLERCMLAWIIDAGILREVPKDSLLQEAQEKLAPIQTELAGLGLQVDVEVRLGEPVLDLLQIAAMSDICAIAVAGKNLGSSWDWIRNFRRDILRGSSQPVIFFPLRS